MKVVTINDHIAGWKTSHFSIGNISTQKVHVPLLC